MSSEFAGIEDEGVSGVRITKQLLQDVRKGRGAYPFNDSMNPCVGDNYYWAWMANRYSPEQLRVAGEMVSKEMADMRAAGQREFKRVTKGYKL